MDSATIEKLTNEQIGRMTSSAYKEAFEDPTTGKKFIEKIEALENAPRTTTRRAGNVRGEEAPASVGFDPSFDDQPSAQSSVAAAQPEAQSTSSAVEPVLAIWEYQPTDKDGRPCGGLQRFKYDPSLPVNDPKSLASQLTKAHSSATSALKMRKTQAVLDAVKEVSTAYKDPEFLDPKIYPNADAVNELTRNAVANGTLSALNLFKQNHPDFVLSESNATAMVGWVKKSKRNPSDAQTWELAWEALKPLLMVPTEEPIAAPVQAAVAATVEPAVRSHVPIASGLSFADGGDAYEPAPPLKTVQGVRLVIDGKNQFMDVRAWDRLSTDVQKRVLRNPANANAIDSLWAAQEQEQAARRTARR
jgi:hypothetical protein